jgi:hypothetical protein
MSFGSMKISRVVLQKNTVGNTTILSNIILIDLFRINEIFFMTFMHNGIKHPIFVFLVTILRVPTFLVKTT